MKNKTTIKVAEWLFDKIYEAAKNYHIWLVGTYKDGQLDHTVLRVEEVLAETEKAYKVSIDAETESGVVKTWTAWIPKSAVLA